MISISILNSKQVVAYCSTFFSLSVATCVCGKKSLTPQMRPLAYQLVACSRTSKHFEAGHTGCLLCGNCIAELLLLLCVSVHTGSVAPACDYNHFQLKWFSFTRLKERGSFRGKDSAQENKLPFSWCVCVCVVFISYIISLTEQNR